MTSGLKRLEAGAERLRVASVRLAALVPALEAWRWQQRTRPLADVARAVVRDEAAVRETLAKAQRRMTVERWPEDDARALVTTSVEWFARLDAVVTRRGFETLGALVVHLVGGERDVAACAVLDEALVATLRELAEALAHEFRSRATTPPFTLEAWRELQSTWRAGEAALDEAWRRMRELDPSGGVERWLRRRADVAPRGTSERGTDVLVAAAYWNAHAHARCAQWARDAVSPVHVRDDEIGWVMDWTLKRAKPVPLSSRGGEGQGEEANASPRQSLLRLAHELHRPSPSNLAHWAAHADQLHDDDDWRRLRDTLHLRHHARAKVEAPLRAKSAPRVTRARRLADFFPP